MKPKITIILVGLLCTTLVLVFILFSNKSKNSLDSSKRVAVFMTMSHPALDQVRNAFVAQMGKEIKIIDYNAENSLQAANHISRAIAHDKFLAGIFAIGTLAAQSVTKVEKTRPIVVAAISDPEALGDQNTNVCGLTDAIDAGYQLDKIINMLPGIDSLSLLYTPHESNSVLAVEKLKSQAYQKNIRLNIIGVYEPQQIPSSALKACAQSSVVLIPLDNQLVAAMPALIKATKHTNCLIITSNESPIYQGAGIAFGIDYEKSGNEAGIIMQKLINKTSKPRDIGFINPSDPAIYINDKKIKELNINLQRGE